MKYAYYPGCSSEGSGAEYAHASEAVLEALGVELEEIDDWVCCGASPAHATSHLLSIALPAITCASAEKQSLDIMTCCACCHSRLKQINQQVKDDPELRAKISEIIEEEYNGSLNVLHITEVLAHKVGLETIKARVRKPLKGLKVACYYGCLMSRMPEALLSDKPEYPMLLDNLVETLGAEPLDWPFKTECCGAALTLSQTKTVIRLSAAVLQMAKQNGADVLCVACPLCQANLDMFQGEAEKLLGERFSIPVIYFVQLMGLAMDLDPKRICLDKLIVDPFPILAQKGFVDGAVYL
jgi:heterodisulfide reductase subunit B